ncbi:MAG TPA: hypothetical protein VGE04_11855, partial [Chloroflexia bacterium]
MITAAMFRRFASGLRMPVDDGPVPGQACSWRFCMDSLEQQIRTRLGIPPTATYVLVIDQAA